MKLHSIKQLLQENHDEEDGYDWGVEDDEGGGYDGAVSAVENALIASGGYISDNLKDAFSENIKNETGHPYSVDVEFEPSHVRNFAKLFVDLCFGFDGVDTKKLSGSLPMTMVINAHSETELGFNLSASAIKSINLSLLTKLYEIASEFNESGKTFYSSVYKTNVQFIEKIVVFNIHSPSEDMLDSDFGTEHTFNITPLPTFQSRPIQIHFKDCPSVIFTVSYQNDAPSSKPVFPAITIADTVDAVSFTDIESGLKNGKPTLKQILNGFDGLEMLMLCREYPSNGYYFLDGMCSRVIDCAFAKNGFDYTVLSKAIKDTEVIDQFDVPKSFDTFGQFVKRNPGVKMTVNITDGGEGQPQSLTVSDFRALYYVAEAHFNGFLAINAHPKIVRLFKELGTSISESGFSPEETEDWMDENEALLDTLEIGK